MRIAILVEGRTEKAFIPFLRDFLSQRLPGRMPELDAVTQDGRIPKEDKLKALVRNLLTGKRPADAVIALTDIYTGTNDFTDATDAKAKMRQWVEADWQGAPPSFYPHVALHDFEAWLLPFWKEIQALAGHNRSTPSGKPEAVNHNHPPSHRLKEIYQLGKQRSYIKVIEAPRILRKAQEKRDENVLLVSAKACPELKAFLNTILELSGGEPIP